VLERLQRHGVLGNCGPQLNEPRDPDYWLSQPGAPKPKLPEEKTQGETVPYDELIKVWAES
jgi:glycerol transport system substrate-binding protein